MNRSEARVRLPSLQQVEDERKELKRKRDRRVKLRSTIYVLIIVAAVAVIVALLLISVLQVTGNSMEPTLMDGDIIVVAKTSNFARGDISAFYFENKILLKRVIGLPGDYIEIDDDGTVSVNGEEINEAYISEKSLGHSDIKYPFKVPDEQLFVLGDDRISSIDSRSSLIGCIEKDQMVGRVIFKIGNVK